MWLLPELNKFGVINIFCLLGPIKCEFWINFFKKINCLHVRQFICLSVFVNLTYTRVMCKEGATAEELPLSGSVVGMSLEGSHD